MAKQHFDKLNAKITEYLTDLSTLRENLKVKESENERLKKEIEQHKSKIEKVQNDCKKLKEELEMLRKQPDKKHAE